MVKMRIGLLCSTAMLGAGALTGAASAQTVAAADTTAAGSEEIVVTAQRRAQAIRDVPQSVQALGGDQLLATGVDDLAKAISLVPSATTGSTISAGSNSFQIRGVAASETDGDATVGFYLDNFAFSLPGRPFAPAVDFYDFQRVEVLRGPSGTLYGLGSLGGTIKVLTNDPDLNDVSGSVRVQANATESSEPGGGVDAMLNAPIIPGKLAVRGVFSYKLIGGYADSIPTSKKNINDARSLTGRVKVLAEPGEDLKIRLTYWRNQSNQDFSNRITSYDPPLLNQTFGIANSKYSVYTGDIEYDLGFATVQSTTGYIKNTVVTNNGGAIIGIGDFTSIWPLTTKNFNEDFRITSSGSGPFRWIVGAFYQDGKTVGGQSVSLFDLPVGGQTGLATFNDNTLKSTGYAVYGEGTYSLFERSLDLTVGGRYFREKRRFIENSSLTLIGAGITTPTVGTDRTTNDTFNPRFNVAYHAGHDGLLYLEAAKGFRSASITSSSIVGGANLALGTNFSNSSAPDTLWNYEAGVKWGFFDNQVNVELSAYYFDWKKAQIELSPTLQTIVVPIGNVHGRGIDAQIDWRTPVTGLRIQASGNINKTELRSILPAITTALPFLADGRQLPGTAKKTFAIAANYVAPLNASGLELRANGRYTYRSRQQSVFDGRYAPWNGLGSARLGIGNEGFDLAVFSDNIGNAKRPISVPGGQVQVPYPRTFGVVLEKKF